MHWIGVKLAAKWLGQWDVRSCLEIRWVKLTQTAKANPISMKSFYINLQHLVIDFKTYYKGFCLRAVLRLFAWRSKEQIDKLIKMPSWVLRCPLVYKEGLSLSVCLLRVTLAPPFVFHAKQRTFIPIGDSNFFLKIQGN